MNLPITTIKHSKSSAWPISQTYWLRFQPTHFNCQSFELPLHPCASVSTHAWVWTPRELRLIIGLEEANQGEIKDHLSPGWNLTDQRAIENCLQYAQRYRELHRLPLRLGFCHRVQEYPWSSLRFRQGLVPAIGLDLNLPRSYWAELEWLNQESLPTTDCLAASGSLRTSIRKRSIETPTTMALSAMLKAGQESCWARPAESV